MNTNEISTKFEQAYQFLESAQDELYRPAEDAVPYMVFKSVRNSISYYLMGFLLKNEIEFNEKDTEEVLLKKCQSINDKFNNFDLSPMIFTKDYAYGAEINQMENCIVLAEYTKDLVD